MPTLSHITGPAKSLWACVPKGTPYSLPCAFDQSPSNGWIWDVPAPKPVAEHSNHVQLLAACQELCIDKIRILLEGRPKWQPFPYIIIRFYSLQYRATGLTWQCNTFLLSYSSYKEIKSQLYSVRPNLWNSHDWE